MILFIDKTLKLGILEASHSTLYTGADVYYQSERLFGLTQVQGLPNWPSACRGLVKPSTLIMSSIDPGCQFKPPGPG